MFKLTWEPLGGGSSLRLSWNDVMELAVEERDWFFERIDAQREADEKELKRRRR